jgi:hypothetical protein
MDTPMLQDYRQSFTSLHAKPRWTDMRPASAKEQAFAASCLGGQFWLDGNGEYYYAPAARRLSDRLVRVVTPAAS